jgi:hypothetical protein
MKLILENWRGYLREEVSIPPESGDDAREIIRKFLEELVILAKAAEDAAAEDESVVGEGSSYRKGRMDRAAQRAHTARIKEKAGLAGIKLKDFTPEQRQLYDGAKAEIKKLDDDAPLVVANTIANGNVLELALVKRLVDLGGAPLKAALTLLSPECVDNLTLRCLAFAASQGELA